MTDAERELLLQVAEALIKAPGDDFGPSVQSLMLAVRSRRPVQTAQPAFQPQTEAAGDPVGGQQMPRHTSSELGHG